MSLNFKVSVVIPVYNQEDYLYKTIPAVLNQTYKNLDVVLVNDGSLDKSLEILSYFKNIDERVQVIAKENGGLIDATVSGIRAAIGEYICFLDPDDLIGEDYIETFMSYLDDDYDCIACGFYYDNGKTYRPYELQEDRIYSSNDLKDYILQYIVENGARISNRFFVARWNKLYKSSLVKIIAEEFIQYKDLTLGEDSLFTFMVLKNSSLIRTVKKPNSYLYNIGNQNSMMKNSAIQKHLNKCKLALNTFMDVFQNDKMSGQAYGIYYILISSLYSRILEQDINEFKKLYKMLYAETDYKKSLKFMLRHTDKRSEKISLILRCYCKSPTVFLLLTHYRKELILSAKKIVKKMLFAYKALRKDGIYKAAYALKYQKSRECGNYELEKMLPLIEERVVPILEPYLDKETDLSKAHIEKNIFVFWWTGFETAPPIVKCSFASVKHFFPDYNIVRITKENYKQYTDIHPKIINGFEMGKVSIQTFSDVLRFNLLKNNGGVWIDATIFFSKKVDLIAELKDKGFSSLEFTTSKDFLAYGKLKCSWSGYFIASRKKSVFATAVNDVFEKYYLKYKTYSIYYFIDAVLMICKKYKLDNSALDKTLYIDGDMFFLLRVLNNNYDPVYMKKINQIPQKLDKGLKKKNYSGASVFDIVLEQYL